MRYVEFPDRPVYHYVKEGPLPRLWCSAYAPYPVLIHTSYVVEVRSPGRRVCKECFKRAIYAGIKIPPRSPWELEQWSSAAEPREPL